MSMADDEANSSNDVEAVRPSKTGASDPQPPERPFCGMVRPIADMGEYGAKHWSDVHAIVAEAAEDAGYKLRLVSESESVGIILNDIVSNIYNDPIVICDVSGRNPNVMFELGMRIAFEKPTIIITDDETPFSFDISPLKHIQYPRSLRYGDMQAFKKAISLAIRATIEAAESSRGYLQQFGDIKVTSLGAQTMDLDDMAREFQELRRSIQGVLATSVISQGAPPNSYRDSGVSFRVPIVPQKEDRADAKKFVSIEMQEDAAFEFAKHVSGRLDTVGRALKPDAEGRAIVEVYSPSGLTPGSILQVANMSDKTARIVANQPA